MKLRAFLICFSFGLFVCLTAFPQTGESKFKMVVINQNEKTVIPLYPSFVANGLKFSDADMNSQLDGIEDGSIDFYLKNRGTMVLQELNVNLDIIDTTDGITYNNVALVKMINPGDSFLVSLPIKGNEKIKDGNARASISVIDTRSDSTETAFIEIPTKKPLTAPLFTWVNPEVERDTAGFSVVNLTGLVKTGSNITGLRIFINGQVPDDKKTFEVVLTDNPNEYRIERTITLNEGDNEIKIEARNNQGTTTSETRIINLDIQKIDQSYFDKRLALVIGNADYVNGNTLQNPVNDAKAIATALTDVGFTVLLYTNSDLKTMKKAMDDFGVKLEDYNVGLFYYAGHGMQVNGNNYLIPVDASMKVEQDVDYDCIDAGRILGKMEAAGTITNIVMLDACRDNPFARSWGTRSASQAGTGLAFMNAPSGSIIAYATSPGKTASDGTGKNGLYTEAILQYIKIPSLSIEDFFKNVRVEVEKKSNRTQTPWESTSLKGNFFFTIK